MVGVCSRRSASMLIIFHCLSGTISTSYYMCRHHNRHHQFEEELSVALRDGEGALIVINYPPELPWKCKLLFSSLFPFFLLSFSQSPWCHFVRPPSPSPSALYVSPPFLSACHILAEVRGSRRVLWIYKWNEGISAWCHVWPRLRLHSDSPQSPVSFI